MRISIEASAGFRDRNGAPASVELPVSAAELAALGPAQFVRLDRKRPVPCQIETEDDKCIAHWIARGLGAARPVQYELRFGVRRRASSARVRVQAAPTGLGVDFLGMRLAELFAPERGTPRLRLFGDGQPVAAVVHHAQPGWVEPGDASPSEVRTDRMLHRRRRGEVRAREGVVFAALSATYDYLDALDRTVVAETYDVRVFAAADRTAIVDYAVYWRADAGGLTIFNPERTANQRRPSLEIRLSRPFGAHILRASGAVGLQECGRLESADIAVRTGKVWIGAFARPGPGRPPMTLAATEVNLVESQLAFLSASWIRQPVRLALGEQMHFRYRFASSTDDGFDWRVKYPELALPISCSCKLG
jgi:hypothetical protein